MLDFLNPVGVLVTVVQLPSADLPAVTPSPYRGLEVIESVMQSQQVFTAKDAKDAKEGQKEDMLELNCILCRLSQYAKVGGEDP